MHTASFRFLQQIAGQESLSLSVQGDCMQPGIARGSSIEVRRRAFYFPGDVIVLRTSAGDLAVHRFLGYALTRDGVRIVTRGDRCSDRDTAVGTGAVLGAVRGYRVTVTMRLRSAGELATLAIRKLMR